MVTPDQANTPVLVAILLIALLLSLLLIVELNRAIVAQEARKKMNRKKAFRETARSSRGVLEEEKMRRRLGRAIQRRPLRWVVEERWDGLKEWMGRERGKGQAAASD